MLCYNTKQRLVQLSALTFISRSLDRVNHGLDFGSGSLLSLHLRLSSSAELVEDEGNEAEDGDVTGIDLRDSVFGALSRLDDVFIRQSIQVFMDSVG